MQDEIAREIAGSLQLTLTESTRGNRTVHPEAHRLVLEGRHLWNLRDEQGFARAEAAFADALKLDPQFAEAHAGMAEVCVIRANYRQFDGAGDTAEDLRRARAAALRAIDLDPLLAEAQAALGFALMLEGDLVGSERRYRQGLALNPNSATIQCWAALLFASRGKLDEALSAYARASALDPLWFVNLHRQSWHLLRAQRYAEAWRVHEQAAALSRGLHPPHEALRAQILFALDRKAEAVAAARVILENPDREPRWQADSEALWVLVQCGRSPEAEQHAAELLKRWPAESYNRGFVLAALGRFEEALPHLARTLVTPGRGFFWDPLWDRWRDDPRFHRLLARLGRTEDYTVARATLARLRAEVSPAAR